MNISININVNTNININMLTRPKGQWRRRPQQIEHRREQHIAKRIQRTRTRNEQRERRHINTTLVKNKCAGTYTRAPANTLEFLIEVQGILYV